MEFEGALPLIKKKPKALLFDVFGTVVDWRKSITLELEAFFQKKCILKEN